MVDFPSGRRSFFAREILEPEENALRIVIVESTTLAETEEISGTGLRAHPVVVDESSPSLELFWDRYIAYAVEDESYARYDGNEDSYPLTSMLVSRETSAYLDYLSCATIASTSYVGAFSHWQLFCENHTINVASLAPPRLRWIEGTRDYPIR